MATAEEFHYQSHPRVTIHHDAETLALMELSLADARELTDVINYDPAHLERVFPSLRGKRYATSEQVEDYIDLARYSSETHFGVWEANRLRGVVALAQRDNGQAEVDTWIGKEHVGHRFGPRALGLISGFVLTRPEIHAETVYVRVQPDNAIGIRTVMSAGFKPDGERNDLLIFSRTRADDEALAA